MPYKCTPLLSALSKKNRGQVHECRRSIHAMMRKRSNAVTTGVAQSRNFSVTMVSGALRNARGRRRRSRPISLAGDPSPLHRAATSRWADRVGIEAEIGGTSQSSSMLSAFTHPVLPSVRRIFFHSPTSSSTCTLRPSWINITSGLSASGAAFIFSSDTTTMA